MGRNRAGSNSLPSSSSSRRRCSGSSWNKLRVPCISRDTIESKGGAKRVNMGRDVSPLQQKAQQHILQATIPSAIEQIDKEGRSRSAGRPGYQTYDSVVLMTWKKRRRERMERMESRLAAISIDLELLLLPEQGRS